jgi:hypothetical protein
MQFIGAGSQQEYVERTRVLDPSQCLAAGEMLGSPRRCVWSLIIVVRSLGRR